MLETLSVFQWSILVLAGLCIGMSKTGVQGMMLLIVPYLAMAFGAKESTGVILPMLCMADIMAVAYYKRIADWKTVAKLLPTALLGFLVALFVDKLVPAQGFRQLMGWTLALAMAVMIWSEIFGKENRWMHKWWYSALFGLLGGFTTMIGNAAGPVMSVYLLSMRKEKMEYIGINALADSLLCLLLGADEQQGLAVLRQLTDEVISLFQLADGLLQVNDIDAVALGVDVGSHLGVPAAGLVTEVDARLQQGLHGYDVRICHSVEFLQINFVFTSGGFIPPADPPFRAGHEQEVDAPCGMLKYNTTDDSAMQV